MNTIRRHAIRRAPNPDACVAGSSRSGVGDRGKSEGPLRLITVSEETEKTIRRRATLAKWVNLIHETLIRSKGLDAAGKPQPYCPTLWAYIERNKERAAAGTVAAAVPSGRCRCKNPVASHEGLMVSLAHA